MRMVVFAILVAAAGTAHAACPYNSNCLNNPYGAGSPYKADGLINPYSQNVSGINAYETDLAG